MDGKVHAKTAKNPRANANIFSVLTFSWIIRTFWVGYRRDLEVTDLYAPLKEHKSSILGDKISAVWENEYQRLNGLQKQKKKDKTGNKDESKSEILEPSLMRVLIRCFGARIMMYGIALAIMEIVLRLFQPLFLTLLLQYYGQRKSSYTPIYKEQNSPGQQMEYTTRSVTQPLFLGRLLRFYNSEKISPLEAYLYAAGVIMCSAVNIFVIHPYMMAILHMGMKMRIACCTLIYRKALRLSKTALGETMVGQAVNLLSNDVNRFDVAIIFLHYLWIGPLETAVMTYFLYNIVGISGVIGVLSLLMFIPLQGFLGKKSSVLRLRTAIRTDERVRLTNEIISGIQAIKMYTWEKPFSLLVEYARKREIKVIRSTSYIRGVIMSFIIFTTRFSLFITILAYVLFDNRITAEKVFMLTAYYNILRQTMTVYFPQGITQIAEAIVSIKRLQKFMMYEERVVPEDVDTRATNNKNEKMSSSESERTSKAASSIIMQNGCAKWLTTENENTLKNISLNITPGQLVAIVGQVGCGKSSLLHVILRELPLLSGSLQVNGNIAYASQEPWLFAGSVQQNILFGRKMDQHRYDQVVKVCQLKRDFCLLPYGDRTVVGERGISLSGGQRARINLARAIYAEASIYLLDDPLSAVDAHVGKHMFDQCIDEHLQGKTRLLVTHQLQYLRDVDKIIVLKDGSILAEGTYDELGAKGVDFGRLLESQSESDDQSSSAPASRRSSRHTSITSLTSVKTNDTSKKPENPEEESEMRSSGSVASWIYAAYLRASGRFYTVFLIMGLCIITQLAASGGDYFIAMWVNIEESSGDTWNSWLSRNACIYIYSALTIFTIVITLIRSISFFAMCMRSSRQLHNRMFRSVTRATMRFFNVNSSGRILNRFSKDLGAVDELLPNAMIDSVQIGLGLLGIIVVVTIANVWLLIPTVVIGIIFYFLRVIYLSTSRSVKRLEGITRSPVFGHLNATIQGLTTIRAFGASEILIKEFDNYQDLHSSAWYIFIASSRAFGFWLDVFCVIYIALVTLSFFLLPSSDSITASNVGLAITQSIGLTGMFQWGMRQSAELENQMTSVERILEYSNIESEPSLESAAEKKPKDDWPSQGQIEFSDVYMRYSSLDPPVLKNLNFVIKPREKVGIVGRTGAGKSSLISALFRLADIKGSIKLDDVDTSEIGLHDFRSKLSIIPQEPFLFSGTLRRNLDPFNTYDDVVLWQALEEVELKEMGLDAHVNEGGSNLSVGQRQLVCLARAIVRNNPILVLDEATANVDLRTDELIQLTIRRKFESCTVLTIAHRLNTVMDSDRIMVMDAGNVAEFDHPYVLLQKNEGLFLNMVKQTGSRMADSLIAVARESFSRTTTL
ncbi:probable multidrug resistance-associated protein lethal(2)03659 isoform X2 [Cephus cinctus]|uniref:Probable multidrug resistance-associated protein lethal(2)03659 isoform X2 n=1 Tax=Cephus cinctus TaxID=211228 RepID=A0AAJ7FV20_CEPCN|nr:probable multidrug resistance-associated protein lethal(2)03659 isoform X2 [Cephus cinctus]